MTGRDVSAAILSGGLVVIVFVYVVAVLFGGYVPSGEGALGVVAGALLAIISRYLLSDRRRL